GCLLDCALDPERLGICTDRRIQDCPLQFKSALGVNHLDGLAVFLFERGPKHFVARDYLVDGKLELLVIERPEDSNGAGYVIRSAVRGQRVQEPYSLLSKGKRYRLGSVVARNDGSCRNATAFEFIVDACRQSFNRRRLEYLSQRQLNIEG